MQTIHLSHEEPSTTHLTSAIFGEHLTYNSRLLTESVSPFYNHDVRIRSTLQFSTHKMSPIRRTSLNSNNITLKKDTAIEKESTIIPLHSEKSQFLNSNSNLSYSTSNITTTDWPLSAYESISNHFLWNSNMVCSQTIPSSETLSYKSVMGDIFGKKIKGTELSEIISANEISSSIFTDEECILDDVISKTYEHKDIINENSIESACKPNIKKNNPHSIEELLKKPDKRICQTGTFFSSRDIHSRKENINQPNPRKSIVNENLKNYESNSISI